MWKCIKIQAADSSNYLNTLYNYTLHNYLYNYILIHHNYMPLMIATDSENCCIIMPKQCVRFRPLRNLLDQKHNLTTFE